MWSYPFTCVSPFPKVVSQRAVWTQATIESQIVQNITMITPLISSSPKSNSNSNFADSFGQIAVNQILIRQKGKYYINTRQFITQDMNLITFQRNMYS